MNDNELWSVDENGTSSKCIPDHEKGAPVIGRSATSGSERFDNGGRVDPKAAPTVGASHKPGAGDVTVAASAQRLDDAGAAHASGDIGTRPAMPADPAPAGSRNVIDDLLDDEPNASALPAYALMVFGLCEDEVQDWLQDAEQLLQDDAAARQAGRHTPPSAKTVQDYRAKVRLMAEQYPHRVEHMRNFALDMLAPHAASKQTYKVMRAALKWHLMRRLEFRVKELRRAAFDGKPLSARSYVSLHAAYIAVFQLNKLTRDDCLVLTSAEPKPPRSNRSTLTALDICERRRFLEASQRSGTYRLAGVILNACGLRPEELRMGVEVEWRDPDSIVVNILGAKVRPDVAGQPWRRMRLVAHALPDWFVAHVRSCKKVTVSAEPDPMRAYLGRLSSTVLTPRRKGPLPRLSAYAFRHALVTDLREARWTTEEIAAAIGEVAADSVAWYGRRRRGNGKVRPLIAIERGSVQTAIAVKPLDCGGLADLLDEKARSERKLRPR